jgi:hypothetical protein
MVRARRDGSDRSQRPARATLIFVLLAILPLLALPRLPEAGAADVVAVIDRAIASGSDDAEERVSNGKVALTSSDLELTADGTNVQTIGLRFTNITVPPGAAITGAWVQFRVDEVSTGATSLTIAGQAADNAPTFANVSANISSRTRTAATVSWVPPSWPTVNAAGPDQQTPDLSEVIRQIVGRPGWVSGNALVLVITGTGRRTAEALEGTGAPALHLEYSTGPASNQPPSVAAGPDQSIVLPATATLDGTVSDDGLPYSAPLSTTWSAQTGPGTVIFGDPSAVDTTASFSEPGTYVLRLSAGDSELSAIDELTVTVLEAGSTPVVLERMVGAGSDDAEEASGGSVSLTSSDLELTTDGTNVQTVGLRFTNITVPPGAAITGAWVQFRVDEVSTVATTLRIFGQLDPNAGTFLASSRNVSSRARTNAFVDWVTPSWPSVDLAGPDQRTPELSAIVQEIVGLPGWSSSNALVLVITGTGRRTAEAFEGTGGPTLHVEYSTSDPQPPVPPTTGFPTRAEALARPSVVTVSGTWTVSYDEPRPPSEATYDLRSFVSTAYPTSTLYAVHFGGSNAGFDLVTVGGVVLGQVDRSLTNEQVYASFAGDAMRVAAADRTATYDLRVDNVVDGYNPRVADGTEQDNTVRFLLEGAYMTYIRDNAVEDDALMSGTIRDCLFDGVFTFLSAKPSSTGTYTNTGMVVTIEGVIARLQAMPDGSAADGSAHNKVFKWAYDKAGTVVVRDSIFYLEEVPEGSTDNLPLPDGVYQNVTVVLGLGFDGDGDGDVTDLDYPVALPVGVTQSRDVSIFTAAREAWLAAHGYI